MKKKKAAFPLKRKNKYKPKVSEAEVAAPAKKKPDGSYAAQRVDFFKGKGLKNC